MEKKLFVTWDGARPRVSVVFVESDGKEPARSLYPLGESKEAATLADAVTKGLVCGDKGEVNCLPMLQAPGHLLLCVDVGSRAKLVTNPDLLRQAGGKVCAYLRSHQGLPAECTFVMPWVGDTRPVPNDVRLALEGFLLRNDNISRTDEGKKSEREVVGPVLLMQEEPGLHQTVERAELLGRLGQWVRHTGNLRGDECSPRQMCELAMDRLRTLAGVTFPYNQGLLDRAVYEGRTGLDGSVPRRWGAFLAVNEGSRQFVGDRGEPYGVLARYSCGNPRARTLALLGKQVNYDTGAWALKTPVMHMADMHLDKLGFVYQVALFEYLVRMGLPLNIILMGNGTYNFPGILPGSFLTTRGGRLVEDFNPDAEGRLTLDDGIDSLVEAYHPDLIMTSATLTGAAGVALGPMINLFSSDAANPLMLEVFQAVRRSGILAWPMPAGQHLAGNMSSPEVDMKNVDTSGAKQAGQSSAMLYLLRALERAIRNYPAAAGQPTPVLNHWDVAPLFTSKPGDWRLGAASVDPLVAAVWGMECQTSLGGILIPHTA